MKVLGSCSTDHGEKRYGTRSVNKDVGSVKERIHFYPPGENQTEQGADEDKHLVEHSRVGPLDGTVEVIL